MSQRDRLGMASHNPCEWHQRDIEALHPQAAISWPLAIRGIVGTSEEAVHCSRSTHEPGNPEEKEKNCSFFSQNKRFSARPSPGGRNGAVLAISRERAASHISGLPVSGPLYWLLANLGAGWDTGVPHYCERFNAPALSLSQHRGEWLWRTQDDAHSDEQTEAWPTIKLCQLEDHVRVGCAG